MIMKNILLKSISLLLSIIMSITALISCASKPDNETSKNSDNNTSPDNLLGSDIIGGNESYETGNSTEPPPIVDTTKYPEGVFPIFDGSQYSLRVVISDKASNFERQVATTLRTELKKKTNASISESTDFLRSGETYDPNIYEILVGETNHTESAAIYDTTSYNNYGIKTVGRKIVLYFSTLDEGEELVKVIINAIKKNDKNAFWFDSAISTSKITSIQLNGVPQYPASASSLSTVDCADNTSMIVATNTTLAKFNEYCKTLTSNGYAEYSKRENIDGNYFRTYTKGSTALTAYFSSGRKQARIIVGPIKDIPSKDVDSTKETFTPSVTMIGPSKSVSGSLTLIYQLANGKFLIIDGGIILADRIYKELRELQPNATKFTIAGWFVSHPHSDHQDGIEYFIEQHGHEVDIENIYFNYATAAYYNDLTSKDHQDPSNREGARVTRLRELIEKKLTRSTRIVKPHTGQIYNFGSASVEIISTVEDLLPTKLPHINEASMVIRVTVAGQSTMVLADISDVAKGIIRSMYETHIKSDMVTLAHHGVWDNTPALYNEIKAKVLFWPNNKDGARMYYTDKSSTSMARKAIQAALDNATDVFLAGGTDTKLILPYTTVGNKQSFINSTLK